MQFLSGLVTSLVGLAMIWHAVDEPLLPWHHWRVRPQHVMRFAISGEALFLFGIVMMIKGWPR